MTKKLITNKTIEYAGLRFIEDVVRKSGCVFSSISLNNDYGNDCYIEFFTDEVATSFCVFAQIKSGRSYKDGKGYKIPTKKADLEYWNNHSNPIVGIAYDNELNTAFWMNISEYLINNPTVLTQKTRTLRISPDAEFSLDTFNDFKNHFVNYIKEYKSYENYGRSLERFTEFGDPAICYDAVKSLYSNHRDKKATWLYIISNFSNIKEKGIHGNVLGMISNYADNPHIFWHKGNMKYYPTKPMQTYISQLVNRYFGEREVRILIPFMREGVIRGTFSFLVFLVLDFIDDVDIILQKIVSVDEMDLEDRNFIFWLYIHFAQRKSTEYTLKMIDEYLNIYPDNDEAYLFEGMRASITENGFIQIG